MKSSLILLALWIIYHPLNAANDDNSATDQIAPNLNSATNGDEEYKRAINCIDAPYSKYGGILQSLYYFLDLAAVKGHEQARKTLTSEANKHFISEVVESHFFHSNKAANHNIGIFVSPYITIPENIEILPVKLFEFLQFRVKDGHKLAIQKLEALSRLADSELILGGSNESDAVIRDILGHWNEGAPSSSGHIES